MLQPEIASEDIGSISSKGFSKLTSWVSLFTSKYAKPMATATGGAVKGPVRRVPRVQPGQPNVPVFTYAEVAQHSTPDDAWVVIEGSVYEISGMAHPGGEVLFSYAGRDATEPFQALHKNQAYVRRLLAAYRIGDVQQPQQSSGLLADWQDLQQRIKAEGLLDTSFAYYTRKFVELLAMVSLSMYLLFTAAPTSNLALVASALLLAMFLFQCGWLQHDYSHNAVCTNSKWNSFLGGFVINLGMGGCAHWWKTKHNQHHATPNKMNEENTMAVDPDIDTVPLIAWSEALLKQVNLPDRGMIVLQHILIWPLLFIALVNWQIQSLIHAISHPGMPARQRRNELIAITIHHLWVNVPIFWALGPYRGLAFWALAHAAAGFGTSFVFIQSHNGMEIYNDDKDFVTSQLVSTRNVNPGVVSDWLMGGLNYQIEHHLFPTMPRHSFSRVRKHVMEFAARHGLPYESCSIWESTAKVYNQLASIAKLA